MPAADIINRIFREFKRYTGDSLPGEPVSAPLPVGDPSSGPHSPKKSELRDGLLGYLEIIEEIAENVSTGFGARYLGAKTSDPSVDNVGEPLIDGALYWNTISNQFRAYTLATDEWSSTAIRFQGAWSNVQAYLPGDAVQSGGSVWVAESSNTNVTPVDGADWTLFLPGATVADGAITNAKLADMAAARIKGRAVGAGTGVPTDLTGDQVRQMAVPRGHLFGLALANNVSDANNDIDISVGGAASDNSSPYFLGLATGLTKRLDAAWAVGNNNGGLDTGSKASSTWYFAFAILRPDTGVVDVLFSTSPASPVMPTNYTAKRRLGAFKTDGSSNIIAFKQDGGWFRFLDSFEPPATNPTPLAITGSAQNVAIGTPVGIKTIGDFSVYPTATSGTMFFGVCDPDQGAATVYDCVALVGTGGTFQWVNVWTNSVGQVSVVANSASGTLRVFTRGWFDPRDSHA